MLLKSWQKLWKVFVKEFIFIILSVTINNSSINNILIIIILSVTLNMKVNGIEQLSEAVAQRCSINKVFLEILQNLQENTCASASFLIKLQAEACNFVKNRLWHRCFLVNFAKFLRTPFLTEHLRWLLLNCVCHRLLGPSKERQQYVWWVSIPPVK